MDKIESLNDLNELLIEFNSNENEGKGHLYHSGIVYRGHSKTSYKCQPSLFRKSNSRVREEQSMTELKDRSYSLLQRIPKSEVEWLALAQHHGIPTRLLDWSESPYIALFFACISNPNEDGNLMALSTAFLKSGVDPNKTRGQDKRKPNSGYIGIRCAHTSPRVTAQQGVFTYHHDEKDIETIINNSTNSFGPKFKKFIIPASSKKDLLLSLDLAGINYSSVYLGLDGLCKHISYKIDSYWEEDI